ncbi:kinase-like domain-containing protein [Aspergillus foveolatus]|uniref:kinase-like domain-containing protein n=1 Tax=Aspergillus foveolatus TaxID=210207 RepID=UPI003CCE4EC0
MTDSEVKDAVASELSSSPFACSSLAQLSGGTANFVYRGVLSRPLPNGTTTVIVKHAEEYLASNSDFKLTAKRCLVEEAALRALDGMQSETTTKEDSDFDQKHQVTVKSPKLLHFSRSTYTQVMEDLPDSVDLKTFLLSFDVSERVSREWVLSISRTIGSWLRLFHVWSIHPAQAEFAKQLAENTVMRDLKFSINYDSLVSMIDAFPDILGDSHTSSVFQRVRDAAAAELEDADTQDGTIGPIHGDLWSGNVLIHKTAFEDQAASPTTPTPLFITDWELAQRGSRALDLGQMIAELYMLKHYKDIDAGLWVIEGFLQGYGYQHIPQRIAFRTLIHVGVHFIFWGSTTPGWGSQEQIHDLVKLGRELVVRAWEADRTWFDGKFWEVFFKART